MDILNPPRISTLEPQTVRVVQHTSHTTSEDLTLTNVYPFETIYSIKQRIALAHSGDKQWLPSQLFLAQGQEAQEDGEQYKSLEFTWSFGKHFADPCDPAISGRTDKRIYQDGAALPEFPTILSGITLEAAVDTKQAVVLHVWNLATVAKAAGFGPETLPTDEAFEGFFRLYFPAITTRDILNEAFLELSESDREAFAVAAAYRDAVDARYAKLETVLHAVAEDPNPIALRELRRLRYTLPKKAKFSTGILELKFYETEPTDSLPFLRFFSAHDRMPPLVKLATTPSGSAKIADTRLLDSLMAEQPATDMGSVILIKSPIQHPRAPLGTAWTLRIMEDGSAELYIGAPRKDAPLNYAVVQEAFRVLPEFLAATPWNDATALTLAELTAVYEYKSPLSQKPTKAELRARVDPFLSIFAEEKLHEGNRALMSLKYKAVSNYVVDHDPVMNYITTLFLRDKSASLEPAATRAYIDALAREFGIPSKEASEYIKQWIVRNEGYDQTDLDTGVPSVNLGSIVNIYNIQQTYLFQLINVESESDVLRILGLTTLLVSKTAAELRVSESAQNASNAVNAVAQEEAVVEEVKTVLEPQEQPMFDEFDLAMMDLGMNGMVGEPDTAVEEEKAQDPTLRQEPLKPVKVPEVLAAGEVLPPLGPQWTLDRLKFHDKELFGYSLPKGDPGKTFSKACQQSQNKQPNVMSPDTYQRARILYGDAVFWVEAPLSNNDLLVANIASKSPNERISFLKKSSIKKSFKEIVDMEKRALRLGFPLKKDMSVLETKDAEKYKKETEGDKEEIAELIRLQQSKPLWTVVRLGTIMEKPNYYICSEYWCLRDDLPLIGSEFEGTVYRNGEPKHANSCAFCGGKLLTSNNPLPGETVLKRDSTTTKGPVAKFIGIQSDINHPDKFPLPCCYATPDTFDIPAGSDKIPPAKVPLPDLQVDPDTKGPELARETMEAEAERVVVAETPAQQERQAQAAAQERENRDRPFSSISKPKLSSQNRWFIPNQNILGRNSLEWFKLERGDVAVPPPSINPFLGQDPEKFLTRIKGVLGEKINSHLAFPASAFVRYGIGNSPQEPGSNLITFIAYAKYATEHFLSESDDIIIPTNEEVLRDMLESKEVQMVRAFEQANYGTLLHEFTLPGKTIPAEREVEFQTWWSRVGIPVADQRAYAENLFLAWDNFKKYVRNGSETKELRIWETLFATPGLLTKTGFVLVRILYPKKKDEAPRIICPNFGISYRNQQEKPPLLFILEDEASGLYDPLVFYEGLTKEDRRVLGVLQEERDSFGRLSASVREPLQGFIADYFSADEGCGRQAQPIHPWIPVADTALVPKLGEFMATVRNSDVALRALLRDRSNRLVGVIVLFNKSSYYVPCLDDGTIVSTYPSMRGEGALPLPPLQNLLEMLTGLQKVISEKKLASIFPGLMPAKLQADGTDFLALELLCGATIPFERFSMKSEIKHRRFLEMRKSSVKTEIKADLPWETDIALLGPKPVDTEELGQTSEEVLDEAYQHLRISFSNWLHGSEQGAHVLQQIELLRQARKRLPLYELQKRLDILLTPIVGNPENPWITTEGNPYSSVLRRDCLQIKKEDACVAGCSWSEGRCLIHAASTPRYVDPVRVLTARLVDELLRTFGYAMEILNQEVPYLKPLPQDAMIKEGESVLFTATGRGNPALYYKLGYTGRKPTTYMMGYTYPEEVDFEEEPEETQLPADWHSTLQGAVFGADIGRDKRAMLDAALVTITEKPIQTVEREIGAPIKGTVDNWKALSTYLKTDIILTRFNPTTQRIEPHMWISAKADPRKCIVLDIHGIPLQHPKTGAFVLEYANLPTSLKGWLDSAKAE